MKNKRSNDEYIVERLGESFFVFWSQTIRENTLAVVLAWIDCVAGINIVIHLSPTRFLSSRPLARNFPATIDKGRGNLFTKQRKNNRVAERHEGNWPVETRKSKRERERVRE